MILQKAYVKSNNQTDVQRFFAKITLSFSGFRFIEGLARFIHNRYNSRPSKQLLLLAELNSFVVSPRFCLIFDEQDKINALLNSFYRERKLNDPTAQLFKFFFEFKFDNHEELFMKYNYIPKERLLRYGLNSLVNSINSINSNNAYVVNKLKTSVASYSNDQSEASRYLYEKNITSLFNVYLLNGFIEEALILYVDTFLYDKNLVIRMDLNNLLLKLKNNRGNNLKKLIEIPIAFYIAARESNRSVYLHLANYLDSNSLERPSQLNIAKNALTKRKLVFFFRFI